jgi:hypothetical protein
MKKSLMFASCPEPDPPETLPGIVSQSSPLAPGQMKRSLNLLIALVAVTLFSSGTAHAGADCEPGQGWDLLRKLARGQVKAASLGDGNNDVDLCLLGPRSLLWWQKHWHSKSPPPHAYVKPPLTKIGARFVKACAPAFTSKGRTLAKELCVALLAEERVTEIADQSVLALGKEIYECGFPLKQIFGLWGAESAREAESQWDSDRWTHCGYGGCSCQKAPRESKSKRRMRRRAKILKGHKLDVLNVLSYIGDAKSIPFLEKIVAESTDKLLRTRAELVLGLLRTSAARSSE